ncbi:hypothetical protein [Archangium lansingense]|uniref:Lipoprotein n=1 Tax=Archangium lansingense TaxID=2995310 RepID=A0ABT3ZY16_9BACT|nr:hypothetical protein [Archangium lansinium]MCY1074295.1 hypothetical protein [Archangium lansinium]
MRALTLFVPLFLSSVLPGCIRHVAVPHSAEDGPVEEPPPGMVSVSVVSEPEDQVWDVYAGRDLVCTTPCTQWFSPRQHLVLKSGNGDKLFIPGVGREALRARHAILVAEGTSYAKRVNGIVFTTLGGMGVVTAITFTAVGCSQVQERGGMCTAGLITGGVSVPLTAFALWMLLDSSPKAHVLPAFQTKAHHGQPPVTFSLAPNGIAGTF